LKHSIIIRLEEAVDDLKQLEIHDDLDELFRANFWLTLDVAAEVRVCSSECIRRLCTKTEAAGNPIAFKAGRDWILITSRWLTWIEQNEGRKARREVQDRLAKRI